MIRSRATAETRLNRGDNRHQSQVECKRSTVDVDGRELVVDACGQRRLGPVTANLSAFVSNVPGLPRRQVAAVTSTGDARNGTREPIDPICQLWESGKAAKESCQVVAEASLSDVAVGGVGELPLP